MKVTYPYYKDTERILEYLDELDQEFYLDEAMILHRRKRIALARADVRIEDIVNPKATVYVPTNSLREYPYDSMYQDNPEVGEWLASAVKSMIAKWDHLVSYYSNTYPGEYNIDYVGARDLDIYGVPHSPSKLIQHGFNKHNFSPDFILTANILQYLQRGDGWQTQKTNAETPQKALNQALNQELVKISDKLIKRVVDRSSTLEKLVVRREVIVFEPEKGHYKLLQERDKEPKTELRRGGHGSGWDSI